jgi:hypothetical protein
MPASLISRFHSKESVFWSDCPALLANTALGGTLKLIADFADEQLKIA